jgi:N-acetylglutamate synthase-like GNAT family acetyltransferase
MTIRTARSADGGALAALHRRASYVWEEDRAQLDAHPEIFGVAPDLLEAGHVRVATLPDGTVIGFATIRPLSHGKCEVEDLFVEPDVMRNGIGRALIEDAAVRAATGGCKVMCVVGAERTRGFYERVGFVVQARAATQFGPTLRLCRTLAS